ncbi:MAG: LamG-like jellyroll fold domain-containing protein [Planctomycetota bacterium]
MPPEVDDVDSDTTFTEGLSGRGLLADGSDVLTLDLPSLEAGTVEFWFNPSWTSGGLTPPGTTRPLLLFRKPRQEETVALVFRQDGPLTRAFLHKGYPPSFRNQMGANNSARWARGTWNHLAFVWDKDKTWAVYVNGVGAGSRVRRRVGSEPFQVNSEVRLFVGSDPDSRTCLNAVIDRLRISSTARYGGQSFEPPRDLKIDEDTLGFFEFEGTTDGTGPVKLRFENH